MVPRHPALHRQPRHHGRAGRRRVVTGDVLGGRRAGPGGRHPEAVHVDARS
ncbi:hypothetical protein [Ornithinimicrobium kibberense]|uniref:hypothetical protein n=1 Tax=Ornithinimicrobium kibberense TaxID=282060 RepID=UPI00360CCFD2